MASPHWVGLWAEWVWPILQFVIGLGLVIFAHELGHFTVAKAVGIRVEQFALGFGPRLLGFRRGETDYRVNLVPMGGYVKMAGQEDFGPLRDQDERDPGSFSNKSIGARFAVISAGVIMNALLASALFVVVCLAGIRFPAPVVGGVLLGSPAQGARIQWQNALHQRPGSDPAPEKANWSKGDSIGLEPGDRILTIDGQKISRFSELGAAAALADPNQKFKMTIARVRNGTSRIGTTQIGVMRMDGHLAFGLMPARSTTFGPLGNFVTDDPFKEHDKLLAINGQSIHQHWEISSIEEGLNGDEATITVLRGQKTISIRVRPQLRIKDNVFFLKNGSRISGRVVGYKPQEGVVALRLPSGQEKELLLSDVVWPAKDEILDILGLVPRLRISGVVKGSPAFEAGLKPDDIIVEYGGRPSPTMKAFLDINSKIADGTTTIVVEGKGQRLPPIEIRPTKHQGRIAVGIEVGIDQLSPVVAFVRAGSPSAVAGIKAGDIFTKVNGKQVGNWIELFGTLKKLQAQTVSLSFRHNDLVDREARIGSLTFSVFDPKDYRFILFPGPRGFTLLMGHEVKKNPLAAVAWGFHETWDFIAMTYAMLVDTLRGTVSYKEFSGPVGIGNMAIHAGRQGIIEFIYFMAIISVSLAVLNFLPIPVVDGGYAAFLLVEKILGRPLPLKIQNGITLVGWALLISFFVLLTWKDIMQILSGLW